jgi:hypothetical protein
MMVKHLSHKSVEEKKYKIHGREHRKRKQN